MARRLPRLALLLPAPPASDLPGQFLTRNPWRRRARPMRTSSAVLWIVCKMLFALGSAAWIARVASKPPIARMEMSMIIDVGLSLNAQAGFAGSGLAAKLPAGQEVEQFAKSTPHHSVIVHNEHARCRMPRQSILRPLCRGAIYCLCTRMRCRHLSSRQ